MRTRNWVILFIVVLGLMLILALQWAVAGLGAPVLAAPPAVAPNAPSADLHVCLAGPPTCDYDSIQDAVDAVTSSTTIMVAAGTYSDVHVRESMTQVVYIDESVSIQGGFTPSDWSHPDPDANPTIIDAQGLGRGVVITGEIYVILEGLHVTGGDATGLGGGPWAYDGVGGGIYVFTATTSVYNCMIYDNVASQGGWGGGGGVYLYYGDSWLSHSTIYNNIAGTTSYGGEGGGLAISRCDAVLSGDTIRDNTAATNGNGLGGGIYMEGDSSRGVHSYPELYDTIVRDNSASLVGNGQGGGIFNGYFCEASLENTAIIENYSGPASGSAGAGYAAEYASATFVHTTFQGNTGAGADGIYAYTYSSLVLTNTILVSHSVGITLDANSTAVMDSVLWNGNGKNTDGPGTFTLTHEYNGNPALAADGYHLLAGSAAIDKAVDAGVSSDIEGETRPYGDAPDLGVDEWHDVIVVDPTTGTTFVYTDTRGLPVIVDIPPGAVVETTTLVYLPRSGPGYMLPPGVSYAGRAFDLDGYCYPRYKVYLPFVGFGYPASVTPTLESQVPALSRSVSSVSPLAACGGDLEPCTVTFAKPITITVYYTDTDLVGLDEKTLRLYYRTYSAWEDAADTCVPASNYERDVDANWVRVAICHLSRFALGGR